MKTLADLKRDLKVGTKIKMIYGNIDRIRPRALENMNKERAITKVQSNGIYIENSWLDFPTSSLLEYDNGIFTIYSEGYRDLNEEEQKAMAEWKKITETDKYKNDSMDDAYSDGSTTYYQELRFWESKKLEHLMGIKTVRGMKLEYNRSLERNMIRDSKVKGQPLFSYEIIEVA